MRPQYLLLSLVATSGPFSWVSMAAASSVPPSDLISRIHTVHSQFQSEGPTLSVLSEYESLVKSLENLTHEDNFDDRPTKDQMAQVYFRKSLIELNLNKVASAIDDLVKVLSIDRSMKPARDKLVDLYLEQGDFEAVKQYVDETNAHHQEILARIDTWSQSLHSVRSVVDAGKFGDNEIKTCLEALENDLIPLTPSNPVLYQYHLTCSKHQNVENIDFRSIVKDLDKLVKLQPVKDLDNYSRIAQYLLFTQNNFDQSWQYVKNCLRVNNDFKPCGSLSKMFVKFQKFLKIMEDYSILQGHLYLVEEQSSSASTPEDIHVDWNQVNQLLFQDALLVSKLEQKKLPRHVKTNYDYLLHQMTEFKQQEQFDKQIELTFLHDLQRLACESFIQVKNYKEGTQFCRKHVIDDINNNPFFPKYVPEVDSLLKNKKYDEALEYLNKFNKNVRSSQLFSDRLKKVEAYQQKRQQKHHHQQQRQRQHQQRQRQHHYQQQQQAQQRNQKPANDYYKILDISRDADDKTIKKAHRQQTLKFHPDKYKGTDLTPEQIENKMQEINKAYEVLSNKELRERYDRGDDPNDPSGGQRQQQQRSPFGSGNGGGFHFQFNQDFMKNYMRGGGGGFNFGGFGG